MVEHAVARWPSSGTSAAKTQLIGFTMAVILIMVLISTLGYFILKHEKLMLKLFIFQEELEVNVANLPL